MKKIYINGNFYTFDPSKPTVQAVVIENGRFIDMGTTENIMLIWGRADTEIIDLEGKTVTPGLTDSHLHLSMVARSFMELDLTGMTSKQAVLESVRSKANSVQPGEWIVGNGWDENLFTDGDTPTIEELDRIAPHTPVFLRRVCYHAAIANSKALEISNFHKDTAIPEGGSVILDDAKKPTGLLLEGAQELIKQPNNSFDTWKNALRKAMKFVMEKGITSVHTNDPLYMGGLHQTYQIYDELLNGEKLGLRCNLLIDHQFLDDLKKSGMYAGFGNDTLQIGAVKIFADGAFGQSTALLSEPYQDDPENFGEAIFDQKTLFDIVRRARDLAMPIAVHTIGDQALENVLNALDRLPAAAMRDRLIHTQVLRKDLIPRLVSPKRIADIQPRFLVSDFPWVQEKLGEKRIQLSYAWKSMIDAGVICAGGSDAPVEPVDPILGIHAAVTRKSPSETHNGWNPNEKLTMHEAFRLFTEMGAYPTNEELIKGTISRGKLADMTVYSHNPFTMDDPDELLETDVEMTIIDGEIKYQRS